MAFKKSKDAWNVDGLRDRLFKSKRRKIDISRNEVAEPLKKIPGRISAKYIREDGKITALRLSSDGPFAYPRYPELDEDSHIINEKENEVTYSLGERGQEFALANNIFNFLLKNNPGTFTYSYKKPHHFYEKNRSIEFGNASRLEGDKIYVNRIEEKDKIKYRFVSGKRFFFPQPGSERNGFEVSCNPKAGIAIVEYSMEKDGADALKWDFISDEIRRVNKAEFDY